MITRNPTEQEHQHAVDDSEEREEKVHEAIEKIVTTIDELTEQSSASLPDSEFETTLPMGQEDDEGRQTAELPTNVTKP
jgi:hypothetical protein